MHPEKIELPVCHNPKVPQPAVVFHHAIDAQLRFNDIDMFGHVNNSVYLQLLDLGKVRYFNAMLGKDINWRATTVVVVNINASFFSPAYFDEKLMVATAVGRISTHSFTLEQRIYNPATGDVKCVAATVMAAFNPSTLSGAELPQQWVDAIRAYEHRDL